MRIGRATLAFISVKHGPKDPIQMTNSIAVQPRSNVPATFETELDNLAAATKGHEKLLKFVKGEYWIMDDEVPLGTEYIAHASKLAFSWIKFVGDTVAERKAWLATDGVRPSEREELGDLDQSQWEVKNGEAKDPWTYQRLMPFENAETGEVVIFTSSSFGGKIALDALVQEFLNHAKRNRSRALPIIRLAVSQMKTKSFGDVARPHFEVVSWEDAPSVDFAASAETITLSEKEMDDSIPF
jgi:hypothetical protein